MAAGCSRPPPPVDLSGAWPATPGELAEVRDAWTRRAVLRGDFHQALEVYATFLAPPWHAAAAAREARARGATYQPEAAQAAAGADYQIRLVVTTHDRNENDPRSRRALGVAPGLGRRPRRRDPGQRDRAR
jgi:hypothetical protein